MKNCTRRMLALTLALALMIPAAACAEAADASVTVYFQDGSRVLIPTAIGNDPEALAAYCDTYFPGRMYTVDASMDLSFDAVLSAEAAAACFGEGSTAVGVSLVTLGLETSVVSVQGQELTVPTACLTFGSNKDVKHLIGTVLAPRTGEASLRETPTGNGTKVAACLTGRIVAVLEYDGSAYTKILYDGVEGYIRTDCLIFHDGADVPVGEGVLHVKGETDGKKSVIVRTEANSSSAKVISPASGTPVKVYGMEDGWYAVETEGCFGYVAQDSLTLETE